MDPIVEINDPPLVESTANLNLPLPVQGNPLRHDLEAIRQAFTALDAASPGKADLVGGKVPASQLPSYVDDVLEFANLAAFPATGEAGKIYIATDSEKTYRWSGSTYAVISDYTLPAASASTLGGIKVGAGFSVAADGTLTLSGGTSQAFTTIILVPSTANQTSFAVPGGYVPGSIKVECNGVGLTGGGDDYTATDGVNVVLAQGISAPAQLTVYVFATFNVANAVQKSGDTMAGPLVVPAGATGSQVPRASEVVSKAGDTMTGPLAVPAGATGSQVPRANEVGRLATANDWAGDQAVPSLNGGQLAGQRNKIINGAFLINQRAVSGTVTLAAGQYGHDRWKAGAAGCTYTFATANGLTTLTITAGTLQQVILAENVPAGPVVLSWGGTAQGRIDAGAYASGSATATAAGGTNVTVEFGTGTLFRPQLEPGTKKTPFEHRLLELERIACRYYFQRYSVPSGGLLPFVGYVVSGTQVFIIASIKTAMRIAPTLSTSPAANFSTLTGAGAYSTTAIAQVSASTEGMLINIAAPNGVTGQAAFVRVDAAGQYFDFNSEL